MIKYWFDILMIGLGKGLPRVKKVFETLADGGPAYFETNLDNLIVEPWNAMSALLFLGVSGYWLFRLRKEYNRYIFIVVCMGILIVGGFGGALYHAFRNSQIFLLLDILPISGLTLAAAVYLWNRLLKKWWHLLIVLPGFLILDWLVIPFIDIPQTVQNSISYGVLTLMILIPLVGVLMQTKFKNVFFVIFTIVCFGLALFFRIFDSYEPMPFSMGTHWLWHLLGAVAIFSLIEYFYRLITYFPTSRQVNQG